MTVVVAASPTGVLLPFQLIYAGKTDKCHPNAKFPDDWDIYHTENQWSNVSSMIRYVDTVLDSYFNKQRLLLNLPDNAKAIALFDVFKFRQHADIIAKLVEHNIVPVFLPASCTGDLQPMDLTVNAEFKRIIRHHFTMWYANNVRDQMQEREAAGEIDITQVTIDMRVSTLKPLHAGWLMSAFCELENKTQVIKDGFIKARIGENVFFDS